MNFLICLLSLFVAALARPDFSYEFQQPLPNNGKHWAVIVAGSNGYFNYRHQVIYSYFFFGYILTAFFFIKSVTIIAVAELISKLDYSTWSVLIDMTSMGSWSTLCLLGNFSGFLSSADYFYNQLFEIFFQEYQNCQTVWI